MALRTIGNRLSTMAPLVARPVRNSAEASRNRDAALDYRAWYKLARWRRLRLETLWRDRCVCAICGKQARDAAQLVITGAMVGRSLDDPHLRAEFERALIRDQLTWVADHVTPHRGQEAMFWDAGNLQSLCKPCHDRIKQREEAADRRWHP